MHRQKELLLQDFQKAQESSLSEQGDLQKQIDKLNAQLQEIQSHDAKMNAIKRKTLIGEIEVAL